MTFCTAISCMDGRIQIPVNIYLTNLLEVDYVDTITEPGPVKILSEKQDSSLAQSIFRRIDVSINRHDSRNLAIVAHHDCAGNQHPEDKQKTQLKIAFDYLSEKYSEINIFALWIDSNWTVHNLYSADNL